MSQGHGFTNIKDIFNFPEDLATELGKVLYPIGSLYFTTTNNDPSHFIKDTQWVLWGGGRVPLGVNAAPSIGGISDHAEYNLPESLGGSESGKQRIDIKLDNMPAHAHSATGNHRHSIPGLNQGDASDNFLAVYPSGRVEVVHDPQNKGPNDTSLTRRVITDPAWAAHQPPNDQNASGVSMTLGRIHDPNSIVTSNTNSPNIVTDSQGNGVPINIDIRQAYITCYMWKRVG